MGGESSSELIRGRRNENQGGINQILGLALKVKRIDHSNALPAIYRRLIILGAPTPEIALPTRQRVILWYEYAAPYKVFPTIISIPEKIMGFL